MNPSPKRKWLSAVAGPRRAYQRSHQIQLRPRLKSEYQSVGRDLYDNWLPPSASSRHSEEDLYPLVRDGLDWRSDGRLSVRDFV
jgi:hypothetical protein